MSAKDSTEAQKLSCHKLPYCYIADGKPEICVQRVFDVAGVLQGAHGGLKGVPQADQDSIKTKVATLYKRIAKANPKEDVQVPWEDSGKRGNRRMERKDFNDVHQSGKAADCLEDWGDLINELSTTMIQIFGMGDSPQADIQDCLEQFGQALMEEWLPKAIEANLGQYLNDQGYCNDSTYVPYALRVGDNGYYGYMSRAFRGSRKAGAAFSQANTDAIHEHVKCLHGIATKSMEQVKALRDEADGLLESLNGLGAPSNPSWREQGTTADDEKSTRRRVRGRKSGAEFSQDNLQMLGEHVSDLHDVADTIHQMAEDLAQNTGASTYTDPNGDADPAKETDKNKTASRSDARSRTHSLSSTARSDADLSIGEALAQLSQLTVKH